MLFLFKRLFGSVMMPLPLVAILFLLGWLLRRVPSQKLRGRLLQLLAIAIFLFIGLGLGERFLYRIEQTFPALEPTAENIERFTGADIVVLGQGIDTDSTLPLRFRENDAFRNRLAEAARIAHWAPESRLIVSMAGSASPAEKQLALEEYATLYGLDSRRFEMVIGGVDTETEAIGALKFARSATIIVVTSASHLPRAMVIFRHVGRNHAPPHETYEETYDFVPAPADFCVRNPMPAFARGRLPLPQADYFANADRLFHETYGRIFERLRGRK